MALRSEREESLNFLEKKKEFFLKPIAPLRNTTEPMSSIITIIQRYLCILALPLCLAPPLPAAEPPSPLAEVIQSAEEEMRRATPPERPRSGAWGVSEVLGLAALLAAIALALLAVRRTRGMAFGSGGGREMRLLDRMAIGRNSTLLLVRLRGRDYWLADHPGGVTLLSELPDAASSPVPDLSGPREPKS